MSKTLDLLGPDILPEGIASSMSSLKETRGKLEEPRRLQKLWRESEDYFYSNGHSERVGFLSNSLDLARLLHASGKSPAEVRAVLRDGVKAVAPILGILDFSLTEQSFSVAKRLAKKFDGRTLNGLPGGGLLRPADSELGPGFTNIRVKLRTQPALDDMEKAMTVSLMAWDFVSARKFAEGYDLQPTQKGEDVNRFGLLREAFLGNRAGALAFLENYPRGCHSHFAPRYRELAEGVIRGDATLVRKALKMISKRFQTAWTLKTYATPARLRRAGSLEKMLPSIRGHLTGEWLLSDWAVAWMSLAWHRGLKGAFSDPSLFSEWAPWELCCPKPRPQ